jgi:hypothetical protein
MRRSFPAALAVVGVLAATAIAADKQAPDKQTAGQKTASTAVTVTKIDPAKHEITLSFKNDKGETQERTFRLTEDVRLLDETGRAADVALFESGNEALVIESEGKLKELRRMPHRGRTQNLSDAVRTRIEMTDYDEASARDLQNIYDMLRKLDTGKNGKLDPQALKAEADAILQERVKEVFNRLDTNRDGKISKDEARGLVKEHFDRIDTNRDGFITLNELETAAKERHDEKSKSAPATEGKVTEQEKR